MTRVLINYATRGFDEVICYRPGDLDHSFRTAHRQLLSSRRGAGYWLWKPYFILRTLEQLRPGDVLFYSDAGAEFIHSIQPLIMLAEERNNNVVVFEQTKLEKHYTRRYAAALMGCDQPRYTDTPQRMAAFSLWKRTPPALELVREWLRYACDQRILTGRSNPSGLPDYEGFVDHRYDQSVFSLVTKKYGVPGDRDPTQWGERMREQYPHSAYPQILNHTRRRAGHAVRRVVRRMRKRLQSGKVKQ